MGGGGGGGGGGGAVRVFVVPGAVTNLTTEMIDMEGVQQNTSEEKVEREDLIETKT